MSLDCVPAGLLTENVVPVWAVADEVVEINRAFPGGYFRSPGPFDQFASRREAFLEAQARREEAVANQVRRDTEWLGRKAAAQTRKASYRVEEAGRRIYRRVCQPAQRSEP